ncbi:Sulfite exporter TauE/SafE family protein [Abeliophyllum distichum]|uniref:Sulfite exporter TauE/SafE family protein n=1 Tax=Abeliophyllum distichum TaxID=126358 RepID=A0ABD1NS04_9LAMI
MRSEKSTIGDSILMLKLFTIQSMIMGAAVSTVYYNLKLRHPTIDMPIIDYDLAVLIQPMLMLGISIGVAFNVIFSDWMVTVLLIILFIDNGTEAEYKLLPSGPSNGTEKEVKDLAEPEVSILENVCWKEFGLLVFVWIAFLVLQLTKNYTATCSAVYWVVCFLPT